MSDEMFEPTKMAPDYAAEALQAYLIEKVKNLNVYLEWPYGNERLQFPSLTITTGRQVRMPLLPIEVLSVTAPDANNQVVSTLAVAEWDCNWQLDLWCRDKAQRQQYSQKVLDAINHQIVSNHHERLDDGLRLTLKKYFGTIASYEITDSQNTDDEQAAQRQERRLKMSMIVNLREIRTRINYAMKKIQIGLDVKPSDFEDDDPLESIDIVTN